jgi:hypothetical protein
MSEQIKSEMGAAKESHSVSNTSADWLSLKLQEAMKMVSESPEKIKLVDEEGNEKMYTPVAVRNSIFRKVFGIRGRIMTKSIDSNQKEVVMESVIDFLMDGKYVRYANAFAGKTQYEAASSQTGKSLLQLAETASIGRVLANIGLSGGEFASIEDLVDFNEKKIDTSSMGATLKQLELIQDLLKEKNIKLKDSFPFIEDLKKIKYEEAVDLIEELKAMEAICSTKNVKTPINKDILVNKKTVINKKPVANKKQVANKKVVSTKAVKKEDSNKDNENGMF